jgi:UDP-2,3-diacylglucosamine pyrophosphatase LpxH
LALPVRYDGAVKRLIIADAHVGQRKGDVAEMADLVRRLPDHGFEELVYLGDAFQYLIGMSKFWTTAVREVMASWEEARGRGVRLSVVEGNRDFFLDDQELASLVDWTGRRYEFAAGSRRFRLDHGDRVNLRDVQYQFWSRVSKSWMARMWARLLPRSIAVAIVRNMEAKLATTNKRFRYHTPIAALRRRAHRAWAEGIDVLLWGHFHTLWECSDGDRLAMVVPAWLETGYSVAVLPEGKWTWVDQSLTPREALPNTDPVEGGDT